MVNKKIWKKALELDLDEKDAKLLYTLSCEQKFTKEETKSIAHQAGLTLGEAKQRLGKLREKGILLKDRISVVDQIRIWDGYYFALIKAAIKPPVVGMETKFPTGWKIADYLEGLKKVEKELRVDMIRCACILQGTKWDILLIVSASSQDEFAEFLSQAAKQGWIEDTWSFVPVEYGGKWIFDPVASPNPADYKKETAENALWKKK